ncbi:MAG: exodeoxyribonuclease VII large subunit [Anaerolineae bacterium]|nr:exodeoxyribonuclease VII large subunit [Anaerolineae bacterium]
MEQIHHSVTQVTQYIKTRFDEDALLQDLWVEGEISNWSQSRTGHCYLTLKDSGAAIRAVIWRSLAERLPFRPQDGQSMLAHGHVSVYEPQGQYQLYIDHIQPLGQGALYLQFEALKARLAAAGLFDAERKRPLPLMPRGIGIVTSPTAAAFQDVLNVLARRWPLVRVILAPTLVQGDTAPPQIVRALESLYGRDDIDAIIVTRGGGSMEDLWAFNDERVARTIVQSPVPVISGVGHEIDFTIADLAADVRAPTPSAAAEIAVPDQIEVRGQLNALSSMIMQTVQSRLERLCRDMNIAQQRLNSRSPASAVARERQRVDDLARRQERAWQHVLTLKCAQLEGLGHRLAGLNPYATLERGYAIVCDETGRVVRTVSQIQPDQSLRVRVSDGEFAARVESLSKET